MDGLKVPDEWKFVPVELTEAMKEALYRPYWFNVCLTPTSGTRADICQPTRWARRRHSAGWRPLVS
jgi:hypothetical protein